VAIGIASAEASGLLSQNVRFAPLLGTTLTGQVLIRWTLIALSIANVATLVGLPVLLFLHLGQLGRRLLSRHMREHCLILAVGWVAMVILALLAFLFLNFGDGLLPSGSVKEWQQAMVYVNLGLLVPALLLVLWGLATLVEFALAFGRELRQVQAEWEPGDARP
jgi:hypothetical protein